MTSFITLTAIEIPTIFLNSDGTGGRVGKTYDKEAKTKISTTKPAAIPPKDTPTGSLKVTKVTNKEILPPTKVGEKTFQIILQDKSGKPISGQVQLALAVKECHSANAAKKLAGGCKKKTTHAMNVKTDSDGKADVKLSIAQLNVLKTKYTLKGSSKVEIKRYFLADPASTNYLIRSISFSYNGSKLKTIAVPYNTPYATQADAQNKPLTKDNPIILKARK